MFSTTSTVRCSRAWCWPTKKTPGSERLSVASSEIRTPIRSRPSKRPRARRCAPSPDARPRRPGRPPPSRRSCGTPGRRAGSRPGRRPGPRWNPLGDDVVAADRERKRLPGSPEQLDVVGPGALADVVARLHERGALVLVRDSVDDEHPDRRGCRWAALRAAPAGARAGPMRSPGSRSAQAPRPLR